MATGSRGDAESEEPRGAEHKYSSSVQRYLRIKGCTGLATQSGAKRKGKEDSE